MSNTLLTVSLRSKQLIVSPRSKQSDFLCHSPPLWNENAKLKWTTWRENLTILHVKNKDSDQPEHLSLIRAFVILFLKSIASYLPAFMFWYSNKSLWLNRVDGTLHGCNSRVKVQSLKICMQNVITTIIME